MPKKNLFVFIVFAASLIAGWWWLRLQLLPPPIAPQDDVLAQNKDKKEGDKPKDEAKDLAKKVDPATAKAEDKAKGPDPVKDKDAVQPKNDGKEPAKENAASPRPPVEEDIPLGDLVSDYFVHAKLTTLGGGVQSLTLPRFKKADENGQPVFLADGKPAPFELIQDDPILPSFLMMDYLNPANPNEKWSVNPLLGQSVWKKEDASTNDKLSLVRFSCDQIPGLRIVKTYTLKPRQYHIGLSVEIQCLAEPKGAAKSKRPFRYQLTGATAPIEGDWYANVYRSSMIGYVDELDRLWRDLGETQTRISFKEGGDKIEPRPMWMQYAGVATQFFSSLIVVNDQQVGGMKPMEVLEYCRPTWESQEVGGIVDRLDLTDPKRPRLIIRTKEAISAFVSFVLLPRTKLQFEQRSLRGRRSHHGELVRAGNRSG